MKFNVSFPQFNCMADPGAVREFAQMVDECGFDHLTVSDHVLGANPASRPDWTGRYTLDDPFREPFVMLGYIAACTSRVRLGTSIVILPQRQTVLVAKQLTEIDLLSDGRAMLGVGVGWNELEFVGLNEDFHTRGRRMEEQVAVLRALWTERATTFKGEFHTIDDAGLNTMPVQQPIPIWMGGAAPRVLQRIARLADGWLPSSSGVEDFTVQYAQFKELVAEAGRDLSTIAVVPRMTLKPGAESTWPETAERWSATGATHLGVSTNNTDLDTAAKHIRLVRAFADSVIR
ncbi:MAG TPA: LLM class F420-dependent oxidoreductase [Chloroflexota bacterium]|nr:LLM class F420-dependent oxidoreductase [Chloroflexota bacterium]